MSNGQCLCAFLLWSLLQSPPILLLPCQGFVSLSARERIAHRVRGKGNHRIALKITRTVSYAKRSVVDQRAFHVNIPRNADEIV